MKTDKLLQILITASKMNPVTSNSFKKKILLSDVKEVRKINKHMHLNASCIDSLNPETLFYLQGLNQT